MPYCTLPVSTAILLATVPMAMSAETGITPPEIFIQQHHEHSPRAYSKPVSIEAGRLVRHGVDRRTGQLHSQMSRDNGRTWGEERFECEVPRGTYMVLPLLSRDGEIHLASMVGRGDGREIVVDRFIDVASANRQQTSPVGEAQPHFQGLLWRVARFQATERRSTRLPICLVGSEAAVCAARRGELVHSLLLGRWRPEVDKV